MLHWHTVIARWTLPGLAVLALSGLYLSATSLGLLGDGSDNEPAWPEGIQAAPHLPLGSLAALRQVELPQLRELEFPSATDDIHYLGVRTASGSGFVNAASGQWISFQRNGAAQNLFETAYALHTGEGMPLWSMALAGLALSTLFLGGSGLLGWWQRRGRAGVQDQGVPAEQAKAVILVGSQGGSTWTYARQLQAQETFVAAAEQGQRPVGRHGADGFAEIEPVAELGGGGVGLLIGDHGGGDDAVVVEVFAQLAEQLGVFGEALDHGVDARLAPLLRHVEQAGVQVQVLPHGQLGIEREGLGHVADPLADRHVAGERCRLRPGQCTQPAVRP